MMAMSGSGCSAIGSASFWSSAVLFLAGAEGGGAGVAAGATAVEPAWARAELTDKQRLSNSARMKEDPAMRRAPAWDQPPGLACPVLRSVLVLGVFMFFVQVEEAHTETRYFIS